jgi:hypothetical protein
MAQVVGTDKGNYDDVCHAKAKQRGQMTFTLVGQDRSTPRAICFWILENIETCPDNKLRQALEDALAARATPNRKNAD